MTPKQKAEQLVEKYSIFAWNENLFDSDVAKKCALMVVDDMLECLDLVNKKHNIFSAEFYQQVKTEIESL